MRCISLCATHCNINPFCLLYSFAWTPHGTYRDPELFVKLLGMSPMDVILATTAVGGELMARPNELGKVQPGYFADVILVKGNPLEDISILSNHENIEVVIMAS